MRWLGATLAVCVVGCSFESGSGQQPSLEGGPGTTSGPGSSSSADPSTTAKQGSSSEDSASSDTPDSETGSVPPTTTAGEETGEHGTTSTSGSREGGSESGPDVDCSEPRVLSVLAEDAELTPPMQLGEYMSVAFAFSEASNAGDAVFTFEVDCPSMYRLFARVRDDDPGISNCCDPDSFVVQGPGGLDVSWFYGCDTTSVGWNWARVEAGELGQTCDETTPVLIPLTPGTHQFTLHNRESNYFDAVAGVAELVLTNDPEYAP